MTVDTNEHPIIDRGHELPAHDSESHRHKGVLAVVWILVLLIVALAVVLIWRHLDTAKKVATRGAEDQHHNRDGHDGQHRSLP